MCIEMSVVASHCRLSGLCITSCTNSSTFCLYLSSPWGAAEGGIARSNFSCAAFLILLRRNVRSEGDCRSIFR